MCCLSEDLNSGFSIYKTFSFQYILWVILDILHQKRLQPLHFTSFGFLFCIKIPPPLYAYKPTRFSKAFLYFQNPPIHIYFVAPNHLSITTIFFYALSKIPFFIMIKNSLFNLSLFRHIISPNWTFIFNWTIINQLINQF